MQPEKWNYTSHNIDLTRLHDLRACIDKGDLLPDLNTDQYNADPSQNAMVSSASFKRTIGLCWDNVPVGKSQFGAKYSVVIVKRIPQWLYSEKTREIFGDDADSVLSLNLTLLVALWADAAIALHNNDSKNNEVLTAFGSQPQQHITFPRLNGADGETAISIFGEIFDSSGRTVSLTVTDHSTPMMIARTLLLSQSEYDDITHISGDVNFNAFGDADPRFGFVHGDSVKPHVKAAPKSKSTPSVQSPDGIIDVLFHVEQIPMSTVFTSPISAVSITNKGKMQVYGWKLSDGKYEPSQKFFPVSEASEFYKEATAEIGVGTSISYNHGERMIKGKKSAEKSGAIIIDEAILVKNT